MLSLLGAEFAWPFISFLAAQVAAVVGKTARESPPAEADGLKRLVLDSLRQSTRGLSKDVVSTQIADDVCTMLARMSYGHEGEHLNLLYKVLDTRGSDVRLDSGLILEGARQVAPYPAFAWDWTTVQSYAWVTPQHINVLELLAFFNYLKFSWPGRMAVAAVFSISLIQGSRRVSWPRVGQAHEY